MTSLNEIRSTFLGYFEARDHRLVASSPLVPRSDPTLLFTNSGMVQFKNIFTGVERPGFPRAATSQKCVRAGGKHNDLDNVGYTSRHHTFFEMLGNFSFGDYFKEQAIIHCWDLLTRGFDIDPDRLLVTVYHDDDDAAGLWKKCAGLADDRIIRIATSDNFWSMGAIGPCGPCSEVYFDYGDSVPGGPPGSADEDGDRFVELWNLVFMQFEQHEDGSRSALPKPSIDTGMGLERIGALLQGTNDNYATDLIRSLIEAAAHATSADPDGPGRFHLRVVADHLRSTAFLISEGVMPSNEGRGYVLRRIMRRAMRHIHLLGSDEPVMHRLVPTLVAQMGAAFPELATARELVEDTIRREETRFRSTLDRGLALLEAELKKLPSGAPLPGEAAFKLYDTFGFPLDLTQDALKELGRSVDVAGFDAAMDRQRQAARKAWKGGENATIDRIWHEVRDETGPTEFLGYEADTSEGHILSIVGEGGQAEVAGAGESVCIVLNQTPFYAEAGGQAGDSGILRTQDGLARIDDTRSAAGIVIHEATVEEGKIRKGSFAGLVIDSARRKLIRGNHSCTHLLHEALRRQLGDHVAQRGSLNDPDRLRFDFSHTGPLSLDQVSGIEAEVNSHIEMDWPVVTRTMTPEEAVELGARALFGEKYGEEVRVVSMGEQDGSRRGRSGDTYSIELCGGTHVAKTGEIGLFVVTGEEAAAAGIRRIEGLTGRRAREYLADQDRRMAEIALVLKARPDQSLARVEDLLNERVSAQREIEDLRSKLAKMQMDRGLDDVEEIGGTAFLGRVLAEIPARQLRGLVDRQKDGLGSGVVVLLSETDGRVVAAVGVTGDLVDRVSAVDIVRGVVPAIAGKGGGGRPDFAQGGGADPSGCEDAIEAARQIVREMNA